MKGKHDDITEKVIKVFYEAYNELGHGFLESVYREAMRIALEDAGLEVRVEAPIPVWFRGRVIGNFRADLIVADAVLVELKSCEGLIAEHGSQTLHYLRATRLEVALLMNVGSVPKFKRFAMDNEKKRPSASLMEAATAGRG